MGIIAKHQGLDLREDLWKLEGIANTYHPEVEKHRLNGFSNTLAPFRQNFEGLPERPDAL